VNALAEALARHAAARPEQPALTSADAVLTYAELHATAGAVATGLRRAGLGPGDVIGVYGEKATSSVVAILGALCAGVAYVPLDPSAPPARRTFLVEDAGCRFVLCGQSRAGRVAAELDAVPVLVVEDLVESSEEPAPPVEVDPLDVAYVMYTSGSTGRPKGVRVPHGALAAFLANVDPLMGVTPESVCLNTSALHFDVSVVDLLYPLARGAHVYLGGAVPLPGAVLKLIESAGVTHFAAVGSTLTMLAQHGAGLGAHDLSSVRRIMTGAEVLNPATVQGWLAAAPHATVINGYGPTEATCLVIAYPIAEREPERQAHYPIGRPLAGTRIVFHTDDDRYTADGPGELLIAGDQLMVGYVDRPEEERAAFVDVDGVRHYRTGDLGRRDPDGIIHFIGRRDDEVKVRGYRINLNEVRRAVESHPHVARAFVAAVPDPREGLALSCAVLASGAPADAAPVTISPASEPFAAELADHVASVLPRYMVPRSFHLLTGFPLLSTGKPDSAALRRLLETGASAARPEAAVSGG
jgi:amino acid adenylation domain-containing protein